MARDTFDVSRAIYFAFWYLLGFSLSALSSLTWLPRLCDMDVVSAGLPSSSYGGDVAG
jgi:hypothetical protein